jgi:glycosyltransferase involved in cell wall biosynthesis
VIHDGIDTDVIVPNPQASLTLNTAAGGQVRLTRDNEVITFVNRNLEPHRGYHVFMRALPDLLRLRPQARVLIVGGNKVSYGARPVPAVHGADNWKDVYIREIRPRMTEADWSRIHFVGTVPYGVFLSLLQVSTVHVYLTYPFVLSWSLLEAMSAGCAIVASDTAPLREVIRDGETGLLAEFFDAPALARTVSALVDDEQMRRRLGASARVAACEGYDLKTVCLPRQLDWVDALRAS